MKARFTKWGPAADYRGAHVVDAGGRLATIVSVHRCIPRGDVWTARLQRFNGEEAGHQALDMLDILEREYEPEPV